MLVSQFWLCFWAGVLSIGWILPNHYYPWLAFHADAWISILLLIAAAAIIWKSKKPAVIHYFTLLCGVLMLIPGFQTLFGLIALPGVAWISTTYIAGLVLAIVVGAQWESNQPNQLGDGLFLAIGIASIISVGLQLQQWLQIDGIELWKMGGRPDRPYANMGQPNQLGTFLLWGLLAVGWGWVRHHIGNDVAILMAAFLLFGIALTGSRTSWIGLMILILCAWYWRKIWDNSSATLAITGLGICFVFFTATQSWLRSILLGDDTLPTSYFSADSGQYRLLAWSLFCDAIWENPWFGYGWYQVVPAQMALAANHPSLKSVFTTSHNIILDLFIWCGIPLGLTIFITLLLQGWRKISQVREPEEVILVLFLAIVANHSMLELPLHYAYLLFPVGLVIGILNVRSGERAFCSMPRRVSLSAWFVITLLFTLIVRDYARVEASYENFRMEKMRIAVKHLPPPDVLLLKQWHEYIVVAYTEPKRGMSKLEIDRVRKVANFFAGPLFIHKLATILALNDQADEAKLWLTRLCKSSPDDDCRDIKSSWARESKLFPEIASIPWPTVAKPE